VLCDSTKRAQYDATGHAGVSERWSTEDLFRDFAFGDFFGGRSTDLGGARRLDRGAISKARNNNRNVLRI
jgi:DnaJ-class molecular chaperone